MQRLGVVAVLYQFVGHLLRFQLSAAEDNRKNAWIVIYNAFQRQIFILGIHHVIDGVNALGALVAATHNYLFVVVQILFGYTLYLFAHSGREHQRVMIGRERLEYLVDTVREAHVQHLISLVKYNVCYQLQAGIAAVHQVNQSARCGHDNLNALFQRAHLWLDGSATVHRLNVQAVDIFGKVAQVVGYLQTELTCWREHQCLRVTLRGVDAFKQWNTERCCFSGTSLGQGYHIVFVAQQVWYYRLLYRHRMYKP